MALPALHLHLKQVVGGELLPTMVDTSHAAAESISASDDSLDVDFNLDTMDLKELILLLNQDLNHVAHIDKPVLLSSFDAALEAAHTN